MNRGHQDRVAYVISSLLFLSAIAASAQMPQPFSADVNKITPGGPTVIGKWYFSPPKMRMDVTSSQEQNKGNNPFGGNVSMIIDGSTRASIILIPKSHRYLELAASGSDEIEGMQRIEKLARSGDPCAGEANVTCKNAGAEAINGRTCDKWLITEKEGGAFTAWVDQKLRFPIKMQDQDGVVTNFTNIKEGAPDPSLFVVPPGYRKFDASALRRQK